jgi:hypothetical protein
MAMSRDEAREVVGRQPGGQPEFNQMMRRIEAMLVINNPDLSAGEIDGRVADIRHTLLGQS